MSWEQAEIEGYTLKRLYEDPERGEWTCLFRMDTGATAGPHAHDEFEQVYVLEGSFNDGEQTLVPGDYVFRAPGRNARGMDARRRADAGDVLQDRSTLNSYVS